MTQTMSTFAISGIGLNEIVAAPQGANLCIQAICIQITQPAKQMIVQFTPGIGIMFQNLPCGFVDLPLPECGLTFAGLNSLTLSFPENGSATGYVVTAS
jgi:hypothetical protein